MGKRVDLVYGSSGSGKTTWALKLADYIYGTTGKKTRWYLGDGGGETIYVTGATEGPDAFVEVIHYTDYEHPLETTQLIAEGWAPGPQGKLIQSTPHELSQIGLFVYEGLTVMSDYIMGDKAGGLADRMSRGESLNKDESYALKDGSRSFGGNARTHYSFTQRRILDLIQRTRRLPGMVLYTAHERRIDSEDTDNRDTFFGPDVCGKALTGRIGASFGNTVHLQKIIVKTKEVDPVTKKSVERIELIRRAYTQEHLDPEAKTYVKYYANCRIPEAVAVAHPNVMPPYFQPPDPILFYNALTRAEIIDQELRVARRATLQSADKPTIRLID